MQRERTKSKIKNQNSKILRLVPALLSWFAKNARDLPWRRTRDPYAIWVSEIMLQQTQVKTVMPYWERWMRELPTISSLAEASADKIHKLWEGLGYYTRVRNMQKAAQEIMARSRIGSDARPARNFRGSGRESAPSNQSRLTSAATGGKTLERIRNTRCDETQPSACEFPKTFDEVLALPGIGRYTAGAICSIAFNQPTPILDGNVIRVLTRVFGIGENPREKKSNEHLWNLAEQLVTHATTSNQKSKIENRKFPACSRLNQSLMELGALICTPREPKCNACPISKHCFAFQENRVSDFPHLEKRPAATARRFAAFVLEDRGKFLVQQRPEGVVNAHLWEFPNIELNGAPADAHEAARQFFGEMPKEITPLCTIKHTITRYRITVDAFRVAVPNPSKVGQSCRSAPYSPRARPALNWLPLAELLKLSFPSAHKKILSAIAGEKGDLIT